MPVVEEILWIRMPLNALLVTGSFVGLPSATVKPEGLYGEILSEYLLTYQTLAEKLERLDRRIEELAKDNAYVARPAERTARTLKCP